MREWRRVPVDTMCGGCPTLIPKDGPALFVKIPNVKRERIRCEECAGSAPPDLPERVVPGQSTKRMQPVSKIAPQFTRAKLSETDWTARILGEKN